MDPRDALAQLGGVATTGDLLRLTSERCLRTALDRGDVERLVRGRYRLPDADRRWRAPPAQAAWSPT